MKRKKRNAPAKEKSCIARNACPAGKLSAAERMRFSVLPRVRVRVEGFNQANLISELTAAGIVLRDILRTSAACLIFSVAKKDSVKTFAILEKLCYTYTVVGKSGLFALLLRGLPRVGLLAGTIAFLCLYVFLQGFVWRVEVSGVDKVPFARVHAALKTAGVQRGGRLRTLNRQAVATAVSAVDGIMETTVEIVGTTVKIRVVESADYVLPQTGSAVDLVSAFDAEITRIVTHSGTALVTRGQRVFAGTPLIGAYRQDAEGKVLQAESAAGQVYGRVAFTAVHTFSSQRFTFVPTGRRRICTRLELFGLCIGRVDHPFGGYFLRSERVYAFERTFLPVRVRRDVVIETERVLAETDVDRTVEQLVAQTVQDTVIRCGGQEIDVRRTVNELAGGMYAVHVFVLAEMPLVQKK